MHLELSVYQNSQGVGPDDIGCHQHKKASGYHCHRGSMAGQRFESKSDVQNSMNNGRLASPHRIKLNLRTKSYIAIGLMQMETARMPAKRF